MATLCCRDHVAMVNTLKRKFSAERGSIILFLALALPIIFFALSITLDIKRAYMQRSTIQQVADGAALVAAKNLPFKELAARRANEYLSMYQMPGVVQLGNGEALVRIERSAPVVFARFFGKSIQTEVKVKAVAKAMNSPKDIVLFMDTSSYMGPSVIGIDYVEDPPGSGNFVLSGRRAGGRKDAWGDNKEKDNDDGFWPAAKFFRDRRANFEQVPLFPEPLAKADQAADISSLLATQQCFNPGFSAMKEAVIRAYDYFAASPLTNVAVMFGPNDDLDVGMVHALEPGKTASEPGVFGYYRSRYGRDEYCLAASEYEPAERHPGYNIPPVGTDFGARSAYPEPKGLLEQRENEEQNWILPQNRRPSVRQVIWSKAVQRGYANFLEQEKIASISRIFQAVGNTLLSVPQNQGRGGLAENASKTAFIYLGNLPHEYDAPSKSFVRMTTDSHDMVHKAFKSSLESLNAKAARQGVSMTIFISHMKHYGSYPQCAESGTGELFACPKFLKDVEAFEEFGRSLKFSNIKVMVLRVADFGTMGQEFAALAPLIGNSSHLVR